MTNQTDLAASSPLLDPADICTLPPDEITARLDWIQSRILPHAVRSEAMPDGVALELADAPGLAANLDRLVELERACCSGIEIVHTASASAGQRRLEAHGADPNAPVFKLLRVKPTEPPDLAGRIAKATGLGAVTGFLVCCVLPVGLAALLGATVAAPFASLDQPWIIAAVSALSAVAAFRWQRRARKPGPALPAAGSSCGC
jgi:hypothetical protein